MSLQINNPAQNLFNTSQLHKTQTVMAKSLARLATGRQIQSAADDVSGLTISDQLQSELLAFNQSIRNANDSISTVQLADGALGQATDILQGVREKTLQAANASQSYESKQAIQAEIDKSLASLHGVIENTTFNGRKIFGDIFGDLTLSGNTAAPLPATTTTENSTLSQNATLAAGSQLAAGSIIKAGTVLTNDISGIGNQRFPAGQTLLGDLITAGTNYLDKAMTLSTGSTVSAGSVLAAAPTSTANQGGETISLDRIDVTSPTGAQQALTVADAALDQLARYRADFGARQNQLASTINTLRNGLINTAAAESKIGDVDLAEEALFFSRANLLNQAQTFAAAQTGRLNAANVMALLQG